MWQVALALVVAAVSARLATAFADTSRHSDCLHFYTADACDQRRVAWIPDFGEPAQWARLGLATSITSRDGFLCCFLILPIRARWDLKDPTTERSSSKKPPVDRQGVMSSTIPRTTSCFTTSDVVPGMMSLPRKEYHPRPIALSIATSVSSRPFVASRLGCRARRCSKSMGRRKVVRFHSTPTSQHYRTLHGLPRTAFTALALAARGVGSSRTSSSGKTSWCTFNLGTVAEQWVAYRRACRRGRRGLVQGVEVDYSEFGRPKTGEAIA